MDEAMVFTAAAGPQPMVTAMMYVPIQPWETPYDEKTALARGTVFPSLDKPFTGEGVMRRE